MDADHAIIWHAYPLGFLGCEPRNDGGDASVRHRLPALIPWLDHVADLGATVLQLGPIFDSESHGYDTRDYFRIDSRLGDEADFGTLVEQARRRGIDVVLDGVFHHVGRSFERFGAADADPSSDAASWFWRRGTGWDVFEGHRNLVSLNHRSPEVRDLVVAVMRHWLDRGIAGWRLDAAYAVPPEFWREVADAVHASHPGAWLLGEVIHGDYVGFAEQSHLDSITQYELWKAIWSSLNDANFHELAWALKRHQEMVGRFVPTTFVGNHDVTRIASKLDDFRHLPHALTVLFTAPGHPSIYAGDEFALRGVKEERPGGDDAVRQAFPAHPSQVVGADEAVLTLHRRLIALRRRNPWLVRAVLSPESVDNAALVYRVRDARDAGRSLVVALNLTDKAIDVPASRGHGLLEGGTGPREAAIFG